MLTLSAGPNKDPISDDIAVSSSLCLHGMLILLHHCHHRHGYDMEHQLMGSYSSFQKTGTETQEHQVIFLGCHS